MTLWQHAGKIYYRYVDNGVLGHWPLVEGNGLTGMRERIEEAAGKLFFSQQELTHSTLGKVQHALQIDVELPQVEFSNAKTT